MKKKLLISLIALILVLNPLLIPRPVKAQIPTTDIASILNDIWVSVIRPTLLETLKRRLLDVMVDQIVVWIQGGGKPKFVTNWRGFVKDAGQQAAGDFVQKIGAGFLCRPFNLQIQLKLLPIARFSPPIQTCTLDKIVGNIENFKKDFRKGGWIAYGASFSPQNNFLGALISSAQTLKLEEEAATLAAINEAMVGNGFLSTKKCQKDANGKDKPGTCVVTTPGTAVGEAVKRAVGADFDYVVNANDLASYAAVITNALINRMISEGADGLLGDKAPASPDGGYVLPSALGGACVGLEEPALGACLQYNGNTLELFDDTRKKFIQDKIMPSLGPYLQAQSEINNATSTTLANYNTNLKILKDKFSALSVSSCGIPSFSVTEVKNAIDAESAYSQSKYDELIEEFGNIVADSFQLYGALTTVNDLSSDPPDWAGFAKTDQEIKPLLNPEKANQKLEDTQSLVNGIAEHTDEKLDKFNSQYKQCAP
ncbi:MAG: hypothetical protein AAB646_00690 [Patescibacteria group bacterium]